MKQMRIRRVGVVTICLIISLFPAHYGISQTEEGETAESQAGPPPLEEMVAPEEGPIPEAGPSETEEAPAETEETREEVVTEGGAAPAAEEGQAQKSQEEIDSEAVSQPGNVTLIFKDADIRTVLHTLSYKSGINIVAANDVEGKVNIRLVDVPWQTALEVILKNQKLTYEKEGNIIRVVTLNSVADEELQTEVFVLNYSKAKDVVAAIKSMLTSRGNVNYDERTNTVIVTDIPTNLYKVKAVMARLDKRTPQVAIEAKIIETTLDKDDKLGINWTLQVSASGGARPTTFPFKRDSSFYGHRPTDSTSPYLPLGNPDSDPPFTSTTIPAFPMVNAASFTFGTVSFSSLSAILELLKSRTDTKIISNPVIVTLDNKEAKVNVSTVFNIPTYERNETTGGLDITGYTEKEIGVILTVTPHVNEAGDIIVDLKPEVSSFLQFDTFGTGTNTIYAPRFSSRTASTQVMIKDGQTIAMGGLVKETATKFNKKVPLLGDIPILGELFKKTEDGIETTDLLIFVTVKLISEKQDDTGLMKETEEKVVRGSSGMKFK